MKYLIIYCLFIILLVVCNNLGNEKCSKLEDYYSHEIIESDFIEKLSYIELDSLIIKDINTSFVGFVRVFNGKVYFADENYGWLFEFDKDGILINQHLGHGRSPYEFEGGLFLDLLQLSLNDYFILDCSWNGFIYNSAWHLQNRFRLNWQWSRSVDEVLANPKPHMIELYGIPYFHHRSRYYKGDIYYQVYAHFDKFVFSNDYIECGRILNRIDSETGLVNIFGRRSPAYRKYKYTMLEYLHFDIADNGDFYISFEIDSLIYVFDNDFSSKYAFGKKGTNMNTDYMEINSDSELRRYRRQERMNKGYYTSIDLFENKELLFRGYTKGNHSSTDGLQIYRGTTLIADVNVPKNSHEGVYQGFRIEGYIAPYFYSNAFIDFENEEIKIYRFKLDI